MLQEQERLFATARAAARAGQRKAPDGKVNQDNSSAQAVVAANNHELPEV